MTMFLAVIFTPVIFLSGVFNRNILKIFFILEIFSYIFFVLDFENIIYIFHNKPVEAYTGGFKRDDLNGIKVGTKNIIDQLPSLISISVLSVILFVFSLKPTIYFAIFYYILCVVILIYLKKKKIYENRNQ
ncbi:hypothetical protein GCM10008932_15880 [Alkalibacterium iburiense]|uniref:Uncharacterized protein n=1 Tax=Alkalibacterium iburiense TaxID=290589 RepID=A0ABP3H9L2_9LACT